MTDEQRPEQEEVRVKIRQLGTPLDSPGLRNIVVLGDEFARELRIEIGPCETIAILRRWEGSDLPPDNQPHAHDLLMSVCETLGAKVEKIVIDDLWNETFFAKLHLKMDGEAVVIDARPSDAIALALRADAPLFAVESVMVTATRERDEDAH